MEDALEQVAGSAITNAVAYSEPVVFTGVWLVASLAALTRFSADHTYRSTSRLMAGSACAGFLAFAVVGFLYYRNSWDGNHVIICWSIAAAIGCSGKKQEEVRIWLLSKIGIDNKKKE